MIFQSGLSQTMGVAFVGLPLGQRRGGSVSSAWSQGGGGSDTKQSEYRALHVGLRVLLPPQPLISENPDGRMVDCLSGLQ